MIAAVLDHLVVAARDLDEGVAYVRSVLGVAPAGGGKHVRMGTHNSVLRLGAACYLEVISVDPEGTPPGRPRWFELDTAAMQERLSEGPRLVTWVARTTDIEALHAQSVVDLGIVSPMERGALSWRITITPDGGMHGGGLIPPLIQWDDAVHPATRMAPSGCSLVGLEGFHPEPSRIQSALQALGLESEIALHEGPSARLQAKIETPGGIKILP